MSCLHLNFKAQVDVHRLTASDTDDTVVAYTTDITVECAECGHPFEWLGIPIGSHPLQPMCSFNGLEARMPIKPQGVVMPVKDLAGFTLRIAEEPRDA